MKNTTEGGGKEPTAGGLKGRQGCTIRTEDRVENNLAKNRSTGTKMLPDRKKGGSLRGFAPAWGKKPTWGKRKPSKKADSSF